MLQLKKIITLFTFIFYQKYFLVMNLAILGSTVKIHPIKKKLQLLFTYITITFR